jgi:hypothetical protein
MGRRLSAAHRAAISKALKRHHAQKKIPRWSQGIKLMPKMSAETKAKLADARKRKKSKVSPAKKAELLKRLGSHVAKKGEKPATKRKTLKKTAGKLKGHSEAHKAAISRGLKTYHAAKKKS